MMLQLVVILLIVGVLAILLELLIPGFDGFISGIVGILALTASAILAVIYVPGGWFFVALNIGVVVAALVVFFLFLKKKQFNGRVILSEDLAEDLSPLDVKGLVGKEGKAVTPLRPYGEADFNGVKVEVSSSGAFIERGLRVKVIETQAGKVIVSPVDGN